MSGVDTMQFVYGFEINKIEAFRHWLTAEYGDEHLAVSKQDEIHRRWDKIWSSANEEDENNLILEYVIPPSWKEHIPKLRVRIMEKRVLCGVELHSIDTGCIDIERYGAMYHPLFIGAIQNDIRCILCTKTPMLYIGSKPMAEPGF